MITQARRFKVPLHKVEVIYVSHIHLDHSNDADLLIEAITYSTLKKKRGILVATDLVLNGNEEENIDRAVSRYHQSLVSEVKKIAPGKVLKVGDVKFMGTATLHDEEDTTGFVLEMDGKKLGYTSDTEYFDGMAGEFEGCDAIVVNLLRATKPWKGHLYPETVIKFLKELKAKPAKVFLTRFGGEFIRTNARLIAKKIEDESGITTIATQDGLSVVV